MSDDLDDATLSLVAHNLRGAIGIAVGATRMVRMRWEALGADRRDELLQLAERGMARVDDAVFGIARGLPPEIIADLQRTFDVNDDARKAPGPQPFEVPEDEEARLLALRRYNLLDQPPAEDLDAIVRIAARIAGSRSAVINLIDANRQWQAAAFGVERGEVPREQSMCAPLVVGKQTVVVADSRLDPRFADHPFVSGELGNVRLYAAVPLLAPQHHVVGTICTFDDEPGQLTDDQVEALEDLAKVVASLFEERALAAELRHASVWQHELIEDLERERRRNEHLLDRLGAA